MEKNQVIILAVLLVAVVAVGAVVAVQFGGDDGNKSSDDGSSDSDDGDYSDVVVDMKAINDGVTDRVHIYGNADNNDTIDAEDVKYIKYIVAEKTEWDQEKFKWADANNDGTVDRADVDYLQNILDKKKDTKLFYDDNWGEVSYAYYPVSTTGNVGTMYWEQATLSILLGIWDSRVTACGNGSMDEITYPGYQEKFSYGKGYNVSPEIFLKSTQPDNGAVVNLIAYPWGDGTAKDIRASVQDAGLKVNVLVPSNKDDLSYVLTMGILLGVEQRAQSYVDIVEGNIKYVQEKTAGIKESDAPKVISLMVKSTTDTSNIGVLGQPETSSANGLYKYMLYTPANMVGPKEPVYNTPITAEQLIKLDPDYILYCSSGCWDTKDKTDAQIQEQAEQVAKNLFSGTRAYKEGHVICTINGTMGTMMAGFAFPELVQSIFPDQIDKAFADDMFNSWFEDGWVSYTVDQKPGYKIRIVGGE